MRFFFSLEDSPAAKPKLLLPVKKSIFDDSSDDEQELFKKASNQENKPAKPLTLFDDDSDDEEYEKLFNQKKVAPKSVQKNQPIFHDLSEDRKEDLIEPVNSKQDQFEGKYWVDSSALDIF